MIILSSLANLKICIISVCRSFDLSAAEETIETE